eukprot:TRINITY_DN8_c0_g1_i1.p1 TRINITY_DN8_c0_g1~~TRINITY_DN8_c0_g1_i1.p1  ORF type:complete len:233 (-),score=55.18 TRINITY_DN8_c0_g1_i1:152-850(-)
MHFPVERRLPRSSSEVCSAVVASSVAEAPAAAARPVKYGPVGGAIEIGTTVAGSYISGGILGYVIGLGMGAASKGAMSGGMGGLFSTMGARGKQTAIAWGGITACFSGFTTAAKVIRSRDDRWNQILGSCGTGAAMCKDKGPQAMLQGCVSYGAFAYILDMLGAGHMDTAPEQAQQQVHSAQQTPPQPLHDEADAGAGSSGGDARSQRRQRQPLRRRGGALEVERRSPLQTR